MGLDQYVFADDDLIFQLRKNYLVDSFFTNLFYLIEENEGKEFNCEYVYLEEENLEKLKKSVFNFFNKEIGDISVRSFLRDPKEDAEYFFSENLQLIRAIEKAFEEGKRIKYTNWW